MENTSPQIESNKSILERLKASTKVYVGDFSTYLILLGFVILAAGITYILYSYTQTLLKNRLQERIIAIASTAATQFDAQSIEAIHGPEDMEKETFVKIIAQLNAIKSANNNLRYVYIMRRTRDINVLEFVADAEMLDSFEQLDTNNNGNLEDDEIAPEPGEPFDIVDYPVLRDEAFFHPAADKDLETDQWSAQLSAYAPIKNQSGESIAILGIDVEVTDFLALTRSTLLPFLLFVLFLILALTSLTLMLVRIWNEKVEAVKELDRQKDELIGIVSHQLAAPVTAVKWYLELLTDESVDRLTKEQQDAIKTMQQISVNLADLVTMILDVSRIQLGRIKIEKQSLNLEEFFREILQVIEPKAKEKEINLIKKISDSLPVTLLDKRMTRMTIENLLTNAIKYTPAKGKVTLSISIKNNNLVCEVADNGLGIPEADQPKIFGKLFRASNVRNSVDGNGFGLFIAKGAIESQDGKIWFKSKEGEGTTFYIELPLTFPKSKQSE